MDSTLAVDEHVAGLIDIHEKAFAHSRSAEIGHIEREISDTPAFVAAVLRRRLRTEVAMINLGALRPVTLSHRVRQSQIDSLMRFDDPLMELRITGADLTRLASESSQRTDDKEQLVFSGYDPHAKTVRHVPIEDDEEYSLATTAFLGTGGDRYFEAGSVDVIQTYQNITLKDAVAEHVRQFGDPLGELEKLARKGSSWKTRTKVSNSLTRTSLNRAAGRYQAVSIISGRDAMAWSTLISSRGSRRTRRGSLVVDVKSSFGQVREEGRFREALDRLDVDAAYTWRGGQPAPFAAAAVSTVWTAPSGQDRPLTLRGSAGLQMRLADHAGVRFGLGFRTRYGDQQLTGGPGSRAGIPAQPGAGQLIRIQYQSICGRNAIAKDLDPAVQQSARQPLRRAARRSGCQPVLFLGQRGTQRWHQVRAAGGSGLRLGWQAGPVDGARHE